MDTKKTCYNKIELCVQNMLNVLGSIIDTIEMAYVVIQREREFHFDLL